MANRFWVGGTGLWDGASTTHWSATSGGVGGVSVPTSSDNVTFDVLSGGGNVTLTANANARILTMGAFTGTLNTNGQLLTVLIFSGTGVGNRTLTLGNSTIVITGDANFGNSWDMTNTTNLIFNVNTSTIKFTGSTAFANPFFGGGLIYNNFWNATTGSGCLVVRDNNTFNEFKSDANRILHFTAGNTQTFTTFTVSGTAGNFITIASGTGVANNTASTSTHALISTGANVSSSYLNIQHSIVSGALFYAGTTSVDNQSVATAGSGWIFLNVPTVWTSTSKSTDSVWTRDRKNTSAWVNEEIYGGVTGGTYDGPTLEYGTLDWDSDTDSWDGLTITNWANEAKS